MRIVRVLVSDVSVSCILNIKQIFMLNNWREFMEGDCNSELVIHRVWSSVTHCSVLRSVPRILCQRRLKKSAFLTLLTFARLSF